MYKLLPILLFAASFSFAVSQVLTKQSNFWYTLNTPDSLRIISMAINPQNHIYLGVLRDENDMGGIFRSIDRGNTWESIGLNDKSVFAIIYTRTGALLASGTNGMWKYNFESDVWVEVYFLIENIISFYESSSNEIYAGSYGRILKSSDEGDSWTESVVFYSNIEVVTCINEHHGNIYATVVNYFMANENSGIWRLPETGESWKHLGLTGEFASSIAFNNNEIIVGSSGHYLSSHGGVLISTDSGKTWDKYESYTGYNSDGKWNTYAIRAFSVVITENNDYYIGGDRQTGHIGGVYKKNGEWGNWERIVSGMDNLNIIYLTIGPENYLYALAQGYPDNSRIYKSINLIN